MEVREPGAAAGGDAVQRNFILQQGLEEPSQASCPLQYSALLFQPRLLTLVFLLGIVLQSPLVFLALAAILFWNAIFPRWNPFDAIYNRFVLRPGGIALRPAPGPRRFAQAQAGVFATAVAVLLLMGWKTAALVLQGLLVLAVAALIFGSFCLGSFVYHLLRGRGAFARRTLPWAGRRTAAR